MHGGDLTEEQKSQFAELTRFEKLVDGDDSYPHAYKAQIYVCLAHDWYQLEMEEEGNRLLIKAETISPGYFKGPVIEHTRENPNFDIVIKNLTVKLILLFSGTLRDR